MSDRLVKWCDWAGVNFKRLCGKRRMVVVNAMVQYYKDHPPVTWLRPKYRAH